MKKVDLEDLMICGEYLLINKSTEEKYIVEIVSQDYRESGRISMYIHRDLDLTIDENSRDPVVGTDCEVIGQPNDKFYESWSLSELVALLL